MTLATDELTWSRTKVSALRECRRKFHFTSSPDNPLKKIKNRYLWSGAFAHDTIGDLIKLVRQEAELPAAPEIIEAAKIKMREQFRVSKTGEGARLFEHEYNVAVDPAVWRNHWDTVERSLQWFLSSKWLERFKTLGPEAWKAVDELVSVDVDGVKAFMKIDCAVETGGRFVLVDWKTSALKNGDEFPLLLGALYAHEVWGADPENIDAFAVSLQDGRQMKAAINEESLMETFLRIQEESAFLQEELQKQNGLTYAQVPMTDDLRLCDRCNFKKLCHAG